MSLVHPSEAWNKTSKNNRNWICILISQLGVFSLPLPCEHAIGLFPAFGAHQQEWSTTWGIIDWSVLNMSKDFLSQPTL